ncbi:glycosyltransferase family 4 protein [Pseudooceanicola nanhaiensis]|uniref:glycosyltransferase family 4 protein n=1 Tax=Pseudooceanicola nanhaiensis TaxID=375761 RepID=UPI001CD32453|nr:glycosyltransferase family 4 protein [Pseudooceanicola nanhaiensis]MCA0918752.1 glycosyltransferase family 4 protein [Pseudooceanicola nanhaiensis]
MTGLPHVVLFYDVQDWAFHNVARNVARILTGEARFTLAGRDDWFGRRGVASDLAQRADVLVFLWRFDVLAFLDSLDSRGWDRMTGAERPAVVTMVYDHLYQSAAELAEIGNPFPCSDRIGASSNRLARVYAASKALPDIDVVAPDGVDIAQFRPAAGSRAGPLRIGWVGNSAWGSTVAADLKGRHSIFDPAIARLQAAGVPLEVRVADRAEARLPREAMPEYYRGIEVLVCSSAIEGTPNPVLEAMAAGVAVVSTDVGIVPDVLGPAQRRFILPERSVEALVRALEELAAAPGLVADLKAENLSRRETLSWETRAALWRDLLIGALEARDTPAGLACTQSIRRLRQRERSGLERMRRLVATNRLAYRAYDLLNARCPALIRHSKRLLARRAG